MSAAWLEGLSEEWKEPSDEAENLTSSSDGGGARGAARTAAHQPSTMDFGSIVVKDPTPFRDRGVGGAAGNATGTMGTTILHGIQEEQAGDGSIVEQQQQQGDGSIIQHSVPGSFIQRSSPKKSVAAVFASSRTPSGGSLSNNNNQLAWAISAFTKGNGNLLAEQTPKTPNRLQMLFIDAASPTPLTVADAAAAGRASMPDALLEGGGEAQEEEVQEQGDAAQDEGNTDAGNKQQETVDLAEEPTSYDENQPEGAEEEEQVVSCIILEPTFKPPSAEFSFHVEKTRPKSWVSHLPTLPAAADFTSPAATPVRSSAAPANAHTPAPPLGLFKFQHDTATREHLRALVEQVDALTSPPSASSAHDADNGDLHEADAIWDGSLEDLRRTIDAAGQGRLAQAGQAEVVDEYGEDEDGRIGNVRSTKRVRLSVSDLRHSRTPVREPLLRLAPRSAGVSGFSRSLAAHTPVRDTDRRAAWARQYPHTARRMAMSANRLSKGSSPLPASPAAATPFRPALRSLPAMYVPAGPQSPAIPSINVAAEVEKSVVTPRTERGHENDQPSSLRAKTPAHVVRNKLEEARLLMERIRLRTTEREQGGSVPAVAATTGQRELGLMSDGSGPGGSSVSRVRPPNPTPMAATLGHQSEPDTSLLEAVPANAAESNPLAALPAFSSYAQAAASIRQALAASDESAAMQAITQRAGSIRSTSGLSAGGSVASRRTFATAPLSRQAPEHQQHALRPPNPRHPVSFSSQASSDRFFTSTSTRVASASTAATSLIASQAGTITTKTRPAAAPAAQTARLVNIPPTAGVEQLLTRESLGDMVFDEQNQRWVKQVPPSPAQAVAKQQQQPRSASGALGGALSPIEEVSGMQTMLEHSPELRENAEEEDDPFRDITCFESTKSGQSHSRSSSVSLGSSQSSSGLSQHRSQRHSRSGSLVLPHSTKMVELDRRSERTSTPPAAAAVPLVSPDLPSIPAATPAALSARQPAGAAMTSNAPRSVLKSREHAFSTPMPGSRVTSADERDSIKQPRSVSFSDGRVSGRLGSVQEVRDAPPPSGLRHELHNTASEFDDGDDESDTISQHSNTETMGGDEQGAGHAWHARQAGPSASAADAYDELAPPHESSSAQSTPTAVLPMHGRSRSLRLRSGHLSQSAISATSTLAWHKRPMNANATILTECSFGVSYDRLLAVLTEVVPFEPSWKDLTSIDLSRRNVDSVVRLKEFLPNLDAAQLADNQLAYLTGLSSPLRFLSAPRNRLSDLTSFVHVRNLETLDISGNTGITSVHQLAGLTHLRTLNADGCSIEDLAGIEWLDSLVHLSLRGNRLSRVRLEGTAWRRLESLDMSENAIVELSGVESLPVLKTISLDKNKLFEFNVASAAPELRVLKLSGNTIVSLDLTNVPNIRTVFADNNCLSEITGTSRLRNLENLSLRDQRRSTVNLPVRDLRDLRRLYISHNPIPTSFPTEQFLNLTLLELACCRLTALPAEFASLVPNCRVLVLDQNFIAELSPLNGMSRLRRLSVVGARLEKVKGVMQTVASLPELETLDLRHNPMTLSFYPPTASSSSGRAVTAAMGADELSGPRAIAPDSDTLFRAQDAQYRRALPNDWLARRSAYRSLITTASTSLRLLDGLRIGRKQRERARDLVERFASSEEH